MLDPAPTVGSITCVGFKNGNDGVILDTEDARHLENSAYLAADRSFRLRASDLAVARRLPRVIDVTLLGNILDEGPSRDRRSAIASLPSSSAGACVPLPALPAIRQSCQSAKKPAK